MAQIELPLKGRASTYSTLVGVVIGLLVAGLLVPLVFGETVGDSGTRASAGDSAPATDLGGDTPAPTGADSAESAAPGAAVAPAGAPDDATGADGDAGPGGPGPAPEGPATTAPGGGGDGGPEEPELGATDRGVTAETITIGALLLEVGNLSQVGIAVPGVDPEQQRRAHEVYIDRINAAGGIHGRTVEAVYETYDVLSNDSMREACLALTRDAKVFTALDAGGIFGPPILCFTKEHRTPLLMLGSQGVPKGYYEESGGYLFSLFASGVRTMRNLVLTLEHDGLLSDTTIGIVSDNRGDPGGHTVQAGAVDTLEELGYEVAHWSHLSEDSGTASSQIPIEVQRMRTQGVDTVFLFQGTLHAQQWVQEADSQRWRPQYYTSDWATGYSDVYAENMPDSFEGSRVLTATRNNEFRVDLPEPAFDRRCRETYERETGEELDRSELTYQVTLRICTLVKHFAWGAAEGGTDLTRDRLSGGVQGLGGVPMGTFGGGRYGAGRFDAAGLFRYMTWQADCSCWMPSSEFRRGRT